MQNRNKVAREDSKGTLHRPNALKFVEGIEYCAKLAFRKKK